MFSRRSHQQSAYFIIWHQVRSFKTLFAAARFTLIIFHVVVTPDASKISKRRLCVEHVIPDYKSKDDPLASLAVSCCHECLVYCVRQGDCMTFQYQNGTCQLLPTPAKCLGFNTDPNLGMKYVVWGYVMENLHGSHSNRMRLNGNGYSSLIHLLTQPLVRISLSQGSFMLSDSSTKVYICLASGNQMVSHARSYLLLLMASVCVLMHRLSFSSSPVSRWRPSMLEILSLPMLDRWVAVVCYLWWGLWKRLSRILQPQHTDFLYIQKCVEFPSWNENCFTSLMQDAFDIDKTHICVVEVILDTFGRSIESQWGSRNYPV